MSFKGVATEATDTEIIITTKSQQDTNTSDALRRLQVKQDRYCDQEYLGISAKVI